MTLKTKFILFHFVFVMFICSVKGQPLFKPGYIRMQDQKVAIGYVQVQTDDQRYLVCRFKEQLTDKIQEFAPNQILGYSILPEKELISGSISIDGSKREFFFEELVNGKVKLFITSERLFVVQHDSSLIALKENNFKTQLRSIVSVCPKAKDQVDYATLKKATLVKIIRDYNLCVASGKPKPFLSRREKRIKIIPTLGQEWSSLNQVSSDVLYSLPLKHQQLGNKNLTKFGVQIQKSFSRRISFRTGLYFKNVAYDVSYAIQIPKAPIPSFENSIFDLQVKFKELDIPVSLQISVYENKACAVYVRGGIVVPMIAQFSGPETITVQQSNGFTYVTNGVDPIQSLSKDVQNCVGLGAILKIKGTPKIAFDFWREFGKGKMVDKNGGNEIRLNQQGTSLSVGYIL